MTGKLHVYTGDGKGKTTAAMGLALRSLGHGRRVLIAQFLKDGRSGELAALKTFERATVYPAKPISGFVFAMTAAQKEEAAKQQNTQAADIQSEAERLCPALTVLDELNVALACGMVTRENAERLIDAALAFGDVVSTGRNAPEWLREKADYVSEIIARKHPFQTEKLAASMAVPVIGSYAPALGYGQADKSAQASQIEELNPNTIRYSQNSVNGSQPIVDSMKANGWQGDPIDVVQMPDGNLTTIDNTRVVAAREAGINVQANVHSFNEPLPEEFIERFTTKNGVPQTWGEAILLRIQNQSGGFSTENPYGAQEMMKIN